MKKSQEIKKYIKKYLFFVLIFIFILTSFSYSKIAYSASVMELAGMIDDLEIQIGQIETKMAAMKATSVSVTDSANYEAQILALRKEQARLYALQSQDAQKWSWEKFIDNLQKQVSENSAVAFKAAARNFVNTLAYDTATYLATGDKGQKPMFETRGWGPYLKDVGDNAMGTFLEKLGSGKGPLQFNLCSPDPAVLLKINLGLQQYARPKAPTCTFSKLLDNWDAALQDKDFLSKFQDMFNPWSNDLGVALTLQTGMTESANYDKEIAAMQRAANLDFKAVEDPLSGNIKTPAFTVRSFAGEAIRKAGSPELVFTGNLLADGIDVFLNTLVGRLMDKWLKKGLVTNFPARMSSLSDIDAQNESEGIAGAENRFRSITEPNFKVRGDYNILAELTMCPDPSKAGPTNCVIDGRFREAIEKRLTVGQALEQGYLNGNGVFGFTSDGLEPKFNEGYPYRSMLILRKFRIIPVGWEIAAQQIKDRQGEVAGTKNLKNLVDCFSDSDEYGLDGDAPPWCQGLVDPNWVLKAEQNFCAREGAGPEILSEQVSGEGTASSLNILRNDTYCADEQSCVKEKNDGSCELYGYCTEERRKWDFNGKSCEPRDNTCQTFSGPNNQTVSYLANTLDYGNCNVGNAGCQEYATAGSYSNGVVDWDASADLIYLNKNAGACDAADQGCHGFIRTTPDKTETYDDIEAAGLDEAYNRFYSNGSIYQKLLPDYLKPVCYDAGGKLLINAPSQCSDFVRECKKIEVGCELYTNIIDGSKIPAKVEPEDYCPAECVGYDTFVQKATSFELSRDDYFIPKTAKKCSAEAAGCEQFTNLDEVAKGGEGVEYYTALRQCLKEADNPGSCSEFYSWEGSDESGYQLKVESLKVSGTGPEVTKDDSTLCTEAIYNLLPSDPAYNADCRQFYNRQGDISYHLYNRTISCSDDCHPYRKTEPVSCTVASADVDCAGGGKCENGSCIYNAIPGQGATCSASQSGCREYTGNTGNDVRNIFTDDFSGGTTGGWIGVSGSTVEPSNESLSLDADNKGSSLLVKNSAGRQVGSAVREGKSYVLSFVAKAVAPADLNISFVNANGDKADFGTAPINLTTNWQIFQTNLTSLTHTATSSEYLLLEGGQNFYIDNITLTEIVDRYYLIKNSWQTPASCDQELDGTPHDQYMLGCDQYADRANQTHYLKSFSELCSESAVGCELMIDTHNSTATSSETFINSGTTIIVPADSFTYVVYDKEKQCHAEAKGCSLLGKAYKYDGETFYGDIYLKNNPDKYNISLCGADAVGCQTYVYNNGAKSVETNFKDPGDMICEWRRQIGAGESYGWLKKKVERCGGNGGEVCLSDADCLIGVECQTETKDEDCPLDTYNGGLEKTLGVGGVVPISQPSGNGWAGICATSNSGCGEYIDPVSKFNNNLIFNGSFQILAVSPTDGWGSGLKQNVNLEPNTVYRLARAATAGSITLSGCPGSLYEIDENNNLIAPATLITVSSAAYANSKIFYYKGGVSASCTITAGNSVGAVELKPVVIDYQLAQNLDTNGCNGIVDFNKGCVLFNERSQKGASLKPLEWDADTTLQGGSPANGPVPADKDSNVILKVTPDRTCDKWLACKSYIKDEKGKNTCYDIGLCDSVDDKGDCNSFIISPKENQTIEALGADKISNISGYAKVGLQGGSLISDYYLFGAMEQRGEVGNIANGGFEFYGSNLYPIGWTWSGQVAAGKPWDTSVFSVINNPISAQAEGIGYAREGRSFLKLGSSYDATSEYVDVISGAEYIITAYTNTKNLKSGKAEIEVCGQQVISRDIGNDWRFEMGRFTACDSRIKVKLHSSDIVTSSQEGNFYFDDIKIRPALESRCRGNCSAINYDPWYTNQVCRLYPKSDSLSCDYYEDSGIRQKGWPGYCLEYDRAPGDPNACILWYPIDKVKGDGIEEGAGYQGKFPLYYCALTTLACGAEPIYCKTIVKVVGDTGQNKYWSSRVYQGSDYVVAGGKLDQYDYTYGTIDPSFGSARPPFPTNNPYEWDGNSATFSQDPLYYSVSAPNQGQIYQNDKNNCSDTFSHRDIWGSDTLDKGNLGWWDECHTTGYGDDTPGYYRTETYYMPDGFDKYDFIETFHWSDTNKYSLGYYDTPMGKYWVTRGVDGDGGEGDHLYASESCSSVNNKPGPAVSQPNGMIQRLFAQSYGAWDWASKTCSGGQNNGASCVDDTACEGVCDQYRCVDTTPPAVGENGDDKITDTVCSPLDATSCASYNNGTCAVVGNYSCNGGKSPGAACDPSFPTDQCWGCNDSFGRCITEYRCAGGAKDGYLCLPSLGSVDCITAGYRCSNDLNKTCSGSADCTVSIKRCVGGGNQNGLPCGTPTTSTCINTQKICSYTGVDCTATGFCSNVFTNPYMASCNNPLPDGNTPGGCSACTSGDSQTFVTGAACFNSGSCLCYKRTTQSCVFPSNPNIPPGVCTSITSSIGTCDPYSASSGTCTMERNCDGGSGGTCPGGTEAECNNCNGGMSASCEAASECVGGCNAGENCTADSNLCTADQTCYNCQASICGDGSDPSKTGANAAKCYSNPNNCSGVCPPSSYVQNTSLKWGPPPTLCLGGVRGVYPNDWCAILPTVSNVKVNGMRTNVALTENGFVNLAFNTKADSNQLPLVMYAVDWGDDSKTVVTGVEMRDRPDPDPALTPAGLANDGNPHSMYHLYSYWDLKAKDNQNILNGDCGSNCQGDGYCTDNYIGAYCRIKPKVQIKDNWGWCNRGVNINVCGDAQWDNFISWVVVREK